MKLISLFTLKYSWAPVVRHEVAHLVGSYLGACVARQLVRVSRATHAHVEPYLKEVDGDDRRLAKLARWT